MTDSRAAGLLLMNTRSSNLSKKRFSIKREVFFFQMKKRIKEEFGLPEEV